MIGTDVAAKAAPDGYTLLAASSDPFGINPLFGRASYLKAQKESVAHIIRTADIRVE
jgi:hypothetical protein